MADVGVVSNSNSKARGLLRGVEQIIVDLVFERLSPKHLAAWLEVPLVQAAACGDRELVARLMAAGADTGCAMHVAIRGGYENLVSDMLTHEPLLSIKDKDGATPIHIAAAFGHRSMIRSLLGKGSHKNALDRWGRTPLHRAAENGHSDAVRDLLEAGSSFLCRYGPRELSPLDVAARRGHVEALRTMIVQGVDVQASDSIDSTALHEAAAENMVESINILLEAGADLSAQDSFEWTPLHRASTGSPEAVTALLEHGADVNLPGAFAQTPLYLAASNAGKAGVVKIVDTLLRWGADEAAADVDGLIPKDVVGANCPHRVERDVERVFKLLENAPADRAWRRRGFFVMCRSLLRTVHVENLSRGLEGNSGDSSSSVVAWTLGLHEGVFRTVMLFL